MTILFEDPPGNALAESVLTYVRNATVSTARDKLINQATADNEPQAEINMYDLLPATTIPFQWDDSGVQQMGFVFCTAALNQHLQFGAVTQEPDGTIRFRPPGGTVNWQFWKGKLKPNHYSFEATVFHETFHLLGFGSSSDNTILPISIPTWDMFRMPETSIPLTAQSFTTVAREMRPDMEAAWVTRTSSSAAGVFKASRGTRTGGDSFQAAHWRSRTRLTPPETIGIMDPAGDYSAFSELDLKFYTRADIEALDFIGWAVDPDSVQYSTLSQPGLVSPQNAQTLAIATPTFEWSLNQGAFSWTLFIYEGTDTTSDDPYRVYPDLFASEFTLPVEDSLPPGQYSWYVVSESQPGYDESDTWTFTIQGSCVADFDGNGQVQVPDIFAFLSTWFASDPSTDIDGNGQIQVPDIFAFLTLWFAGC